MALIPTGKEAETMKDIKLSVCEYYNTRETRQSRIDHLVLRQYVRTNLRNGDKFMTNFVDVEVLTGLNIPRNEWPKHIN